MSGRNPAQPPSASFDTVAAEYDDHRPTYPDELVERACAGLVAGDAVLEVGCGSGQLTRSLAARGLRITAVEPGEQLVALASQRLPGVAFVNVPFERAELGSGQFRAVFSASAFHWVDPDVGWTRAAELLGPRGTLGLVQYCGVSADDDQPALMAAIARVAPEVGAGWPVLRPLDAILAGIEDRRDNVSEVWSWVGQYDLGRAVARRLFDGVRSAAVSVVFEQAAAEVIALVRTLSPYHRMAASQQAALETAIVELEHELGRPIRSTVAAVLVTAQKAGD